MLGQGEGLGYKFDSHRQQRHPSRVSTAIGLPHAAHLPSFGVLQAQRKSKHGGDMTLPARERVKLVRSLQCVDAAVEAVDEDASVAVTLQLLHPDIFANGGGQTPTRQEIEVCERLNIQMVDGLGIQLLSLAPFTQHYDWGKPRNESIIAALTGQQSPHLTDEPDARKPFAEMWMGDHPSGPARVVSPGTSPRNAGNDKVVHRTTSLQDVFHKTPSVLGPQLRDTKQLPFLLKVLSIHKALSIQAHPDKELAARLHRERPQDYKDPNHKPEIAIALTDDFQALCRSAGWYVSACGHAACPRVQWNAQPRAKVGFEHSLRSYRF